MTSTVNARVATAPSTVVPKGYSILLACLAGLLVVNSIAGPLALDWLDYPLPDSILNQQLGLEAVTVALVVPAFLLAAALARRGNPAAPVVGFGPSSYAAYMFVQYVVGPAHDHYSVAVVLQLLITALSLIAAAWSWSLASRTIWQARARRTQLLNGFLLMLLGTLVLIRYLPVLLDATSGRAIPSEFAASPAFYWSIVLLDLSVVVPATFLASAATFRAHPRALLATCAVFGWFLFVVPSVASMAAVMLARNDPNASFGTVVLLTTASVLVAVVVVPTFVSAVREGADRSGAPLSEGPASTGPSAC